MAYNGHNVWPGGYRKKLVRDLFPHEFESDKMLNKYG
jgi:hypothetical protein